MGVPKEQFDEWVEIPWTFPEDTMCWDGDRGGTAPLLLEDYQRQFMDCPAKYRGVNKSRQVGYSFVFAVESLTRAIMDPGHTSMFVSYNLDDAREKITIIHKLLDLSPALHGLADFDALKNDVKVKPKWARKWSLIRSLPCRPVRGKTKADLYLDEIAHYQDAEQVYLGSAPATVRSLTGGQITVASTPNGRAGIFWECIEGPRSRPYWKQNVPWWESRYLCSDVELARREAGLMTTDARISKFALPNLVELYDGMALIDFQQEFECDFVDDGSSYFPMDLLNKNVCRDRRLCRDFDEVLEKRHPKGQLFAGVDIGRFKDTTEVVILDRWPTESASTGYAYSPMMVMTMDRVNTQEQGDRLETLLKHPAIERLWIDTTGIGLAIGERLRNAFPRKVVGVMFTTPSKELMCVLARRSFERLLVDLPDPEHEDSRAGREARLFIDHIHSIKRHAGTGRHARYEAESTTHHGDQFWAFALVMLCAHEDLKPRRDTATLRDVIDVSLEASLV